jgi:hypothetical protein
MRALFREPRYSGFGYSESEWWELGPHSKPAAAGGDWCPSRMSEAVRTRERRRGVQP